MTESKPHPLSGTLTALVEYQVRIDTTSVPDWLDVWEQRGQDALMGEPQTLAYEALRSADNDSQVLIFERYENGDQSLQAHSARPAHSALKETMGAGNMTKRRVMSNLFVDIKDYGWWERPHRVPIMREAEQIVTIIGTRFASASMKAHYLALTGEHAAYCLEAEPDTLIYSAGTAVRDSDRGPDIKTGDLLFVAGFADMAAVIKHRDDPKHQILLPKLQDIERQRTFLQTYRSTGKGYMWKSH